MKKSTVPSRSVFRIVNLEKEDTDDYPETQPKPLKALNIAISSKHTQISSIDMKLPSLTEENKETDNFPHLPTENDLTSVTHLNKASKDSAKNKQQQHVKWGKEEETPINGKSKSVLSNFYLSETENLDEIKFRFDVFLEIMIYQIIFFFVLGPFIHVLLLIPFVNKHALRNLQFLGLPGLLQSIQWALLMIIIVLYAFNTVTNNQIKDVYAIEVYDPFLITFIRMIFISSKFALSSPKFMRMFHSQTLNAKDLINEYVILSTLIKKDPALVEEQVQESILRLKTDTSAFYFTFMGHDPDTRKKEGSQKVHMLQNLIQKAIETKPKITKSSRIHPAPMETESDLIGLGTMEALQSKFKSKTLTLSETIFKDFVNLMSKNHSLEKEMLSGYSLSMELVNKAKASFGKALLIWGIIFGIIRALLPLISRLFESKSMIPSSKLEICISIATMISTFWFFSLNYVIASASLVDLTQKYLLLSQSTTLLPSNIGRDPHRCTPPFNIYNPISLKCWESIRDIFVDYGNRYQSKESCNLTLSLTNLTISLTVYLIQLFIIILYLLNIIKTSIAIGNSIVLVYEVVIIMGVFTVVLVRGSQINDLFAIHRSRLLYVKRTISNMIVMKKFYLENKEMETDNPVIQQGILYFRRIFPDNDEYVANCVTRLDQLQKIVAGMIENLDANSEDNPVKVFGFRITFQTIKGLAVALVSIGVAVYKIRSD